MSRGPWKPETKLTKAKELAEQAAKALGIEGFKFNSPIERQEDKILEANATLEYVHRKGKGFTKRECGHCGQIFAYSWRYESIRYCSPMCIKARLAEIGIDWDANRPLGDRYRNYPSRPAVVPPEALLISDDILKDQPDDTPPE